MIGNRQITTWFESERPSPPQTETFSYAFSTDLLSWVEFLVKRNSHHVWNSCRVDKPQSHDVELEWYLDGLGYLQRKKAVDFCDKSDIVELFFLPATVMELEPKVTTWLFDRSTLWLIYLSALAMKWQLPAARFAKDINPFDQPGVEESLQTQYVCPSLGKPGQVSLINARRL